MRDPFTRFDAGDWRDRVLCRFGGASPPPVQQAAAPPTIVDPSVQQAAADAAAARAQSAGRYSTILTGGQGDTSTPSIMKAKLLGQSQPS